jgi:hypothetical protein
MREQRVLVIDQIGYVRSRGKSRRMRRRQPGSNFAFFEAATYVAEALRLYRARVSIGLENRRIMIKGR